MLVKGRISWFKPEEWVKDKTGQQIYSRYGEPIKKRKIGVDADYELEDGTIVKERYVTETDRDFSDEELQKWMDDQITRQITLHFDEKESQSGYHFMTCYLTSVRPLTSPNPSQGGGKGAYPSPTEGKDV